jgi:hypothetical protein
VAPRGYVIQVRGHLASEWSDWFEGLTIRCRPDGTTTLSGPIRDQAALFGVLLRVRDLGLPLVSVNPIEPGQDLRPMRRCRWENPSRKR